CVSAPSAYTTSSAVPTTSGRGPSSSARKTWARRLSGTAAWGSTVDPSSVDGGVGRTKSRKLRRSFGEHARTLFAHVGKLVRLPTMRSVLVAAVMSFGCHTSAALDPDAQIANTDAPRDGHAHVDAWQPPPPDALVYAPNLHVCSTGCCRDVAAI